MKLEAIIFDLDGVLIDSAPCHAAAFERVLAPFGVTDFVYSDYAGWRTPEVIEDVFRKRGIPFTPELIAETAQRKSAVAYQEIDRTNPVVEGAVEMLRELANRLALGLASSGSRPTVELFLRKNGCAALFRSVLTGGDVQHAKPDPEIYAKSFKALHVEPANAAVVEDAVAGVRAARAAGAGAIIGFEGTSAASDLRAAGATRIIERLADLCHAN